MRSFHEESPERMTDPTNDSQSGKSDPALPAQTANGSAKQPGANTLYTVADIVRRVMRADTASVVSFSIDHGTITWRAMSGAHTHLLGDEIVRPLRNAFERCATRIELITLEGIGETADLPAEDFPVLSAEGVRYAALAPLCARDGEVLGALVVGFRSAHRFTTEEEQMLEALADMAALA